MIDPQQIISEGIYTIKNKSILEKIMESVVDSIANGISNTEIRDALEKTLERWKSRDENYMEE